MAEYRPIKVTLLNDPMGEDLGTISMHTFTLTDGFVLKGATNMTFVEMVAGLDKKDPDALRALVWFMKHKRGDGVHISTIDFSFADFSFEVLPNPTEAGTGVSEMLTSESSPTSAT